MKKLKRILLLIVVFLTFLIVNVYAAEGKIEIVKDFEKIEPGKTGTVQLKLTSTDKAISGIKMKVKSSEKIEITGVTSASDKWTVTAYNSDNGLAILTNADGAQNGNIAKITFKVKENATEESISVENFEVSSVDYDYVTVPNISTKIIVEKVEEDKDEDEEQKDEQEKEEEQEDEQEDEQEKEEDKKEQEEDKKQEQEQEKQEEQQQQKPSNQNQQQNNNKVNVNTNTNKNTNIINNSNNKPTKIPAAGRTYYTVILIGIITIVGIVSYIKYKKIY